MSNVDAGLFSCVAKHKLIQDVKRSFRTACTEVGIMDFRVHDLRHTCAAWLVTAGVALPVVRDLLGHSTIKMTERYAHLAPETVRAALDILASSRFRHVEGEQSARTALSA